MSTEITIGCDPEFGLIKNGGLVTASQVIGDRDGEFGVDGNGRVAELRPHYGHNPKELVMNIGSVLKLGYERNEHVRELLWKAGSMACDEPIGGHIHFGHSKLRNGDSQLRLGMALDRTLAVLALMLEDGEEALNRRYGSSYGSLGGSASFRAQSHGVEYRVLASWLTSPTEAEAILSLAYIIGTEFESPAIMDAAASLPAFDSVAFKECDKIGLMYYIKPIVNFIRTLPKYKEYESSILPMFKLIRDQKTWSCDKDMKDTWAVKPAAEVKKKTIKRVTEYV